MKSLLLIAALLCIGSFVGCNRELPKPTSTEAEHDTKVAATKITNRVVEVSCGQCQLEMDGDGCDLAVRIDETAYFVDGSSIDDHGDAHGQDGLCNCIRKAKVSGEISDGRFEATSIDLIESDNTSH